MKISKWGGIALSARSGRLRDIPLSAKSGRWLVIPVGGGASGEILVYLVPRVPIAVRVFDRGPYAHVAIRRWR